MDVLFYCCTFVVLFCAKKVHVGIECDITHSSSIKRWIGIGRTGKGGEKDEACVCL